MLNFNKSYLNQLFKILENFQQVQSNLLLEKNKPGLLKAPNLTNEWKHRGLQRQNFKPIY